MLNVPFDGSREIGKPPSMTDEECSSLSVVTCKAETDPSLDRYFVVDGNDVAGYPYFASHWQPSKEDMEAMNAGRGFWVKTIGSTFQPIAIFTVDEAGEIN